MCVCVCVRVCACVCVCVCVCVLDMKRCQKKGFDETAVGNGRRTMRQWVTHHFVLPCPSGFVHLRVCVHVTVCPAGLSMWGSLSSTQIEINWCTWNIFGKHLQPSQNPSTDSLLLTKFGILLHISHLLSLPGAEGAILTFHKAPDFDIWWPR